MYIRIGLCLASFNCIPGGCLRTKCLDQALEVPKIVQNFHRLPKTSLPGSGGAELGEGGPREGHQRVQLRWCGGHLRQLASVFELAPLLIKEPVSEVIRGNPLQNICRGTKINNVGKLECVFWFTSHVIRPAKGRENIEICGCKRATYIKMMVHFALKSWAVSLPLLWSNLARRVYIKEVLEKARWKL